MAKITTYIPEPSQEYSSENQRQVLQALETLKDRCIWKIKNISTLFII
jgi:hypothetical protein